MTGPRRLKDILAGSPYSKRVKALFTDRDIAADRDRYERQKRDIEINLAKASGVNQIALETVLHEQNMKIAGLGR